MRWLVGPVLFASACATVQPAELAEVPRSILVVPPINDAVEVGASELWLSTATRPLADRGYYVFPVGVVLDVMRDNGLPSPAEMNEVSPARLHQIFGADAILYSRIKDFGTEFQVVNSKTSVAIEVRLVDGPSGKVLWEEEVSAEDNSASTSPSGGGPLGLLAGAVASAVANQVADSTSSWHVREVSARVNHRVAGALPYGPRFPKEEASEADAPKSRDAWEDE